MSDSCAKYGGDRTYHCPGSQECVEVRVCKVLGIGATTQRSKVIIRTLVESVVTRRERFVHRPRLEAAWTRRSCSSFLGIATLDVSQLLVTSALLRLTLPTSSDFSRQPWTT